MPSQDELRQEIQDVLDDWAAGIRPANAAIASAAHVEAATRAQQNAIVREFVKTARYIYKVEADITIPHWRELISDLEDEGAVMRLHTAILKTINNLGMPAAEGLFRKKDIDDATGNAP